MSHNGSCLYHLDGEAQELRDQREPEGDVGLALRRTLSGPFQGEVVGGEQRRSLGRGAQALRAPDALVVALAEQPGDRKSTRLNSSHSQISYAVFCLKKKKNKKDTQLDN